MLFIKLDDEVINHLLFHKALIDEDNDMSRVNHYIAMVKQASQGQQLSIGDPFDRSIYLAFDLVLKNQFNPWDIDLVSFSSLYLNRAKEEKIDLLTAGRIIYMAWQVLHLQSDHLVVNMEAKKEQEPIAFEWDDLPTENWLHSDDGYSYMNLVMNMPKPPLDEPIRRETDRKVTLIELLGAFDEARKEAEEYQLVDRLRREERERLDLKARKAMTGTAHEDHLEEDIAQVWKRIQTFPKKTMSLTQLYTSTDADERIKTFLSVLFLAYDKKITIFQKHFPFGQIFIKTLGYT